MSSPPGNRRSTKGDGAYETILVSTKGKVGIITLNRPNALNALNAQLIERGQSRARRLRGR